MNNQTSPKSAPETLDSSKESEPEAVLVFSIPVSISDTLTKAASSTQAFLDAYNKVPIAFVDYIAPLKPSEKLKNKVSSFDIAVKREILSNRHIKEILSNLYIEEILPKSVKRKVARSIILSMAGPTEQILRRTEKSSFGKEFRAMLPVRDLGPGKNMNMDLGDALLLRAMGLPCLAKAIASRMDEEEAKTKADAIVKDRPHPTTPSFAKGQGVLLKPKTP